MVVRLCLHIAALVCGAVSVLAAFRCGERIGETRLDATLLGLAGVAVVALSWLMPIIAASAWSSRAHIRSATALFLWLITALFTLINSVGYASHNRATVTANQEGIAWKTDHDRARVDAASESLTLMKRNALWSETAGCSFVPNAKARRFCDSVKDKEALVAMPV